MRNPIAAALIFSALTLGSTAAEAQQHWTLRLSPAGFDTDARFSEDFPASGTSNEVTVDGAIGLGASLERALGNHWGLEAGLLATKLPATLEIRTVGGEVFRSEDDLQVVSPFLMFNWRPRREARFAPFLGLGVAWTQFGDLRFFDDQVESGDDFGWVAQAGAELRLKGRLRLFASVILLDTSYQGRRSDADATDGIDLDVEIRALRVGLAIPFG